MSPGKSYNLVLTHDIDVLSVREIPPGSRTLEGFFYRCVCENLLRLARGRISLQQYFKSVYSALEAVPAKFGVGLDEWARSLGVMLDMERSLGVRSTLYFITVWGEAGIDPESGNAGPVNRTVHYRLAEYRELLSGLVREGWEVGVHGLNAWRSLEDARDELQRFRAICPEQRDVGIRMHWLYQRSGMYKDLEEAGYWYDSTLGWNHKIGFPEGRFHPFYAGGSKNFVVLPLNIQDVAILAADSAKRSLEEAWGLIERVLEHAREHAVTVTVLWHNHNFGAPRFWGPIYERVIRQAQRDGAEIMTAAGAVARFKRDAEPERARTPELSWRLR